MGKIALIITHMPGGKYYAKKGLKKPIVVYVSTTTYNTLAADAQTKEWSMQTYVRRTLDDKAKAVVEEKAKGIPRNRTSESSPD